MGAVDGLVSRGRTERDRRFDDADGARMWSGATPGGAGRKALLAVAILGAALITLLAAATLD